MGRILIILKLIWSALLRSFMTKSRHEKILDEIEHKKDQMRKLYNELIIIENRPVKFYGHYQRLLDIVAERKLLLEQIDRLQARLGIRK